MNSLFRTEVFEARRTSHLGSVSLAQPLSLWILTLFAALAATLVVLFLVFGSYTRRVHVVGHLEPVQGMATVVASTAGVVIDVLASEGDEVNAGDTLAVISARHATAADGETSTALLDRVVERREAARSAHEAQRALLDAQASGLRDQREAIRQELAQTQSHLTQRIQAMELAQQSVRRMQQLHASRYVSDVQLEQQQAVLLERTGEVQTIRRQKASLRRQLEQLEQSLNEIPHQVRASEAGLARELALLDTERIETAARGEILMTAPASGIVATQMLKVGQTVQAGQPVLSILSGAGTLEAELLVPSRSVGFIAPGDEVLLRYHAFPFQKFGHHKGRVERVSRSTLPTSPRDTEPLYRVNVELERQSITAYGTEEPLKPGMLVDAAILGERRTLTEWILEPLYSIKGSIFSQ